MRVLLLALDRRLGMSCRQETRASTAVVLAKKVVFFDDKTRKRAEKRFTRTDAPPWVIQSIAPFFRLHKSAPSSLAYPIMRAHSWRGHTSLSRKGGLACAPSIDEQQL